MKNISTYRTVYRLQCPPVVSRLCLLENVAGEGGRRLRGREPGGETFLDATVSLVVHLSVSCM